MKKTYSNPEMQVVIINAPQLLAGSVLSTGTTPTNPSSSDVRDFDFFDDDDNF